MKCVYLISCVKSKQKTLPSCRAEEMYISPLYRASLSYALSFAENKTKQVFILSALYGLLSLDETISCYEKTLGAMSASKKPHGGAMSAISLLSDLILKTPILFSSRVKNMLRRYENI
ncbi:hypothetical protein LJC63_02925 [Ruminococcaceae bacterium OttesenSCG-928-L11]|nr:hypothetical protein [Ruminococcaceae bacterium OttesenSCG-928-L11]